MSAIVLNTGSFCAHFHGLERYTKALKGKSAADDNEIAQMFPLMRQFWRVYLKKKGFKFSI